MDDIDLRTHKSFMTYPAAWSGTTYGVERAFDRNNLTFLHTTWVGFPQYLDNGYNWVMVELDTKKFQMVDSVTLVIRTGKRAWLHFICK